MKNREALKGSAERGLRDLITAMAQLDWAECQHTCRKLEEVFAALIGEERGE